ncbi:L,D-transpeptidase [Bartonella apis]|uniref:L,D-transpeptidase n=1 Tax=Bartonella apis TaxID=1686310 RepID=UPI0018DC5051|nr:L,D-transpeptidase [Bartonella apis]
MLHMSSISSHMSSVSYLTIVVFLTSTASAFSSGTERNETIELAQLYDPADLPRHHQQLRIYQDQYGRRIYVDENGRVVRVEEPQNYPQGVTPPPYGTNNQGPMEGGAPYDDRDVPEAPDAKPYHDNGQVNPRSYRKNPPRYQAGEMPSEHTPAINVPKGRETVAAVQILMDRLGSSPGAIDGLAGSNFDKAAAAASEISGRFIDPNDKQRLDSALQATGGPAFTQYTITEADINRQYVSSIPADYAMKAQMPAMAYTSVREMLAERFHIDESFLQELNPQAHFSHAGESIKVPNLELPKRQSVDRIVADKARKQVRGYNAEGRLVVAYPATIGSTDNPSPSGTVQVERIAFNPNYTYNPKVNFKQGSNNEILTIPPGPNGPVGTVWIALSKPTYGIHGTPDPSRIGKTSSHGCIRLTNWDAEELAKLVKPGVVVHFTD